MTDNFEITRVKWVSAEKWRLYNDLFRMHYKGSMLFQKPNEEAEERVRRSHDVAEILHKGNVIAFCKVLDYKRYHKIMRGLGAKFNFEPRTDDHTFIWHDDRPDTLNCRSIEEVWVHPKYRKLGLATRLYRYAVQRMAATNLHIDESRVLPKLDYWHSLGFDRCVVFTIQGGAPTFRLHQACEYDGFFPLTDVGIFEAFRARDMKPNFCAKKKALVMA